MPIYEFYSPDTNKIYSFYAKTLAQGKLVPKCPDNPRARMKKLVSAFAISGRRPAEGGGQKNGGRGDQAPDARMEDAMASLEREFGGMDENDPKAMARMMRRMAEVSGEKLDAPMEEAIRKLEEGADPDALEDQLGDALGGQGDPALEGDGPPEPPQKGAEPRARFKVRRPPPARDPRLYDYE